MLSAAWAEGARLASLQCQLLYIECGCNKGDMLEALVHGRGQGRDYREHGLVHMLTEATGSVWTGSSDQLAGTCVQAFEMNEFHTLRLRTVEATIRPQLRDVRVYTETALVGTEQQRVYFAPSGMGGGKDFTAAHIVETSRNHKSVPAVNFADYVRSLLGGFNSSTIPVVIRMDVEGSEVSKRHHARTHRAILMHGP